MLASERVLKAVLTTTHLGLVFIRNHTLSPTIEAKYISSLAEALHEIPAMVQRIQYFAGGEAELLQTIRLHLAYFEHARWPDGINLSAVFERELGHT